MNVEFLMYGTVWNSKRPWEDSDEWVSPELLVLAAPACSCDAKVGEGSSQESVRDLDLREKTINI